MGTDLEQAIELVQMMQRVPSLLLNEIVETAKTGDGTLFDRNLCAMRELRDAVSKYNKALEKARKMLNGQQ